MPFGQETSMTNSAVLLTRAGLQHTFKHLGKFRLTNVF